MSSTEPNKSYLLATAAAAYGEWRPEEEERRVRAVLLGLCATIAAATLAGCVCSLFALSRMRRKTSLCLLVASLSADDLLGAVALSLFTLLQWGADGEGEERRGTLCTVSGVLYVFQGVSGNMTACLIAAHTFYVTKRFGGALKSPHRRCKVLWAVAAVWTLSLLVSLLPLCAWGGGFAPATLGCFPDGRGFYGALLFALYSVCCGASLVLFAPLAYRLLCSREPQRTLFPPSYFQISGGLDELPSCSRDGSTLDTSLNTCHNEASPGSFVRGPELRDDAAGTPRRSPPAASSAEGPRDTGSPGDSPVWFAQKRFSMILAVVRVVLWMPIMVMSVTEWHCKRIST